MSIDITTLIFEVTVGSIYWLFIFFYIRYEKHIFDVWRRCGVYCSHTTFSWLLEKINRRTKYTWRKSRDCYATSVALYGPVHAHLVKWLICGWIECDSMKMEIKTWHIWRNEGDGTIYYLNIVTYLICTCWSKWLVISES